MESFQQKLKILQANVDTSRFSTIEITGIINAMTDYHLKKVYESISNNTKKQRRMKTPEEILEKLEYKRLILDNLNTAEQDAAVFSAMQEYAQQFIDAASDIIIPAVDILPDTYNSELEHWFNLVEIHMKNNSDEGTIQ